MDQKFIFKRKASYILVNSVSLSLIPLLSPFGIYRYVLSIFLFILSLAYFYLINPVTVTLDSQKITKKSILGIKEVYWSEIKSVDLIWYLELAYVFKLEMGFMQLPWFGGLIRNREFESKLTEFGNLALTIEHRFSPGYLWKRWEKLELVQ